MKYRTIGSDPATQRSVSVLSLGAMLMGSRTDEETSFAILDRYVSAGGTFIDTSGNYAFWVNGTQGGESEELLGRWRRSRGIGAEVVIATKVGARPLAPAAGFEEAGATANQVVLAWLMGGEVPVIPLVGASSVAQLEESLAAVDLELTAAQRAALDAAH